MKLIRKLGILFIFISLIFLPVNSNALSKQTALLNVNETENLNIEDFSFSNISFKNYSYNSTKSFGLSGILINNSKENKTYIATIEYFDNELNLLAKTTNTLDTYPGINDFNQMANLSILNNYSVDEIAFYRLTIDIPDNYQKSSNTPSSMLEYENYSYVIDQYDINIIVNENNTFDITEKITAYFNTPKHGIFRSIPLKNEITRLDGTTSNNRAQITNLSVDKEYKVTKQNGLYKIRIGSKDQTLLGEQTYEIKYTYNIGKDPLKTYDELYYNIIGDEWDTVIGNIIFNITMPKNFDSSKLGFSSGSKGSLNNNNIKYNVNGNKITGRYDSILNPKEAITIRCELPEGYFVNANLSLNYTDYLVYILPLLFLFISILIWFKYGRDDKVIETVEFYPPEGFNSLEIGFLYKGKANNQDVVSLLIYLANKGYIKIAETEEKSLFSTTKGFKITKLKEYDGENINEQIFLRDLFSKKSSILSLFNNDSELESNENEVTSSELYNNFYITVSRILSNINNKDNKNKIFEKSASKKSIFIILMMILTYSLITVPPSLLYGDTDNLIFYLLFPGIGLTIIFFMVFKKDQPLIARLFGVLWGIMFGGMSWAFLVLPILLQDHFYFVGYIIGMICIVGMIFCLKYLPKRTKYGNEILGKISGFKNYLETVEKDKLEAMVIQNPDYFYDILPFTYVLGISDKWIKKFETISIKAPTWYDSRTAFDMVMFGSFINSTMKAANSSMTSSPSSSSGSSMSSGGGSSGGGSGGGGGGSW